jgi:hypothetical protein
MEPGFLKVKQVFNANAANVAKEREYFSFRANSLHSRFHLHCAQAYMSR